MVGSLTFEIKQFIEKNIKLIENNDFDNFFYRAEGLFNINTIGILADVFKTIGCNPLEYMTFIPKGFFIITDVDQLTVSHSIRRFGKRAFQHCSLKELVVPSSVYTVNMYCFAGSDIETIHFEEGVVDIGEGCFLNCTSLKEVYLPSTIMRINESVFEGCSNLSTISYGGRKRDWVSLPGHQYITDGCDIKYIVCFDGLIEL